MEPFKIGWMVMINDPSNGERLQQLAFTNVSLNRFVVFLCEYLGIGCLNMYIYIFLMLQSVLGIRFRIDGFARKREREREVTPFG